MALEHICINILKTEATDYGNAVIGTKKIHFWAIWQRKI